MKWEKWRARLVPDYQTRLIAIAAAVGLLAGGGAAALRGGILWFERLADQAARVGGSLPFPALALGPFVGGLCAGILLHFLARGPREQGVPEVMAAVLARGGLLNSRLVAVRTLAAALSIGFGGSAGQVGPSIYIGSGFGSSVARLFRLPDHSGRTLVACGAASGIAAILGAPIGGVLFALEAILGEFCGSYLSLLVVSVVPAVAVARYLLGGTLPYGLPGYTFHSLLELPLYLLVGVAGGLVAALYTRAVYAAGSAFGRLRALPVYLRTALGGLGVGVIGFFLPQVLGLGEQTVALALAGGLGAGTLALLAAGKLVATTLTIGSGIPGGVVAPALFIGAGLGGALGQVFHLMWPALAVLPQAYALVGMGAVLAGAGHVPLAATVILFEITRDFRIVLPLMLVCLVSTLVARAVLRESIFTYPLVRSGLDVEAARRADVLKSVLVRDVMKPDVVCLPAGLTVDAAADRAARTRHQGFPVVDGERRLVGIITRDELMAAVKMGRGGEPLGHVARRPVVVTGPHEPVSLVAKKLGRKEIGRVVVVDTHDPALVIGIITRSDILRAYGLADRSRTERVSSR